MKPNGFSFKNILTISTFGTFFFTMAALAGLGTGAGSLKTNKLSKQELSEAIKHVSDESGRFQDLPSVIKLDNGTFTQVEYTLDKELQEDMEDMFKVYQPDYGAFAAIDVETGKVLSLVSYNKNDRLLKDHLALRATFPSASVFKVVTASAAIAEKKMTADSIVAFNGRNHTLYKGNIFKNTVSRWTKRMSLKEAFGLSVNTVFAKLGAFTVGADELRDYAGRFGFNRKIASDLPIQEGRANIVNDAWSLAETVPLLKEPTATVAETLSIKPVKAALTPKVRSSI
jgi:cell division protein FtsI/penicillin-binding protein 2